MPPPTTTPKYPPQAPHQAGSSGGSLAGHVRAARGGHSCSLGRGRGAPTAAFRLVSVCVDLIGLIISAGTGQGEALCLLPAPPAPRGRKLTPLATGDPLGEIPRRGGLSLGEQRDGWGGPEGWERGPGEVGKGTRRGGKEGQERCARGSTGNRALQGLSISPIPKCVAPMGDPTPGCLAPGGVTSSGRARAQREVPPRFHGAVSIFICLPFCRGGESDEAGKRA